MIRAVDFALGPLRVGEARTLRIDGAEPHTVEIHCFVNEPPPPGYRPCPECGTLDLILNGQPVEVHASATVFAKATGHVRVTITDSDNDQRVIILKVLTRDTGASSTMTAGA
jgi:hypothetical protein